MERPMAVQAVADEQDTPPKLLDVAPAGLGMDWIDQRVPFQCSASVGPAGPAVLVLAPPTAVQALADVHDTPLKLLKAAPAGLGVDWIDQRVPFQRSASVSPLGLS